MWSNELVAPPPVHVPVRTSEAGEPWYEIWAVERRQQVLPVGYPTTPVFVYGGLAKNQAGESLGFQANFPANSFETYQVTVWVSNQAHVFKLISLL